MPFFPGPGVGGHCIPVDPHYLSWKLKKLQHHARFVELAGEINAGMPLVVTQLVAHALNERGKPVNGSRVLVLGVAYKADVDDVRESPALDVIELLAHRRARVAFSDPHVPSLSVGELELTSVSLDDVASYDAVVIVTKHRAVDYGRVCAEAQLVIDTRNATRAWRRDFADKIFTL
jgi:UDP-N-acetyl-D-glucosamine dehydrogenase